MLQLWADSRPSSVNYNRSVLNRYASVTVMRVLISSLTVWFSFCLISLLRIRIHTLLTIRIRIHTLLTIRIRRKLLITIASWGLGSYRNRVVPDTDSAGYSANYLTGYWISSYSN